MNIRPQLVLCGCSLLLVSSLTQAATSTGTIAASITLQSACLINGSPSATGINFGTLAFGTHPATLTSNITTQLTGAVSGNTFTIECNNPAYTVEVTSSTNTAPTTVYGTPGTPGRYMIDTGDATKGVAYGIYSDNAFANVIANNAPLTPESSAGGVDSYTVYGQVQVGSTTVATPGTYNDTINVSVTY